MAGGLGRTGNDGQEKEGNEQVEGDQDDPSRAKKKARVSHNAFNWKCPLFDLILIYRKRTRKLSKRTKII